jgi:hypothetical protein
MSNKLAQLMERKMDRRDFLKYGIGVVLALVGITGLLRTLTGDNQSSNGYGDRPYGQ